MKLNHLKNTVINTSFIVKFKGGKPFIIENIINNPYNLIFKKELKLNLQVIT